MSRRGGGLTAFELTEPNGETRRFSTVGRFSQTLLALIEAGPDGITSLEVSSWALRLAHFVYRLRRDHALLISMELEEHGGDFPGHHGRYRLLDRVRVLGEDHSAAALSTSPASSLDAGGAAA